MADEQIDIPDDERSPFARPTFIVAAVLVLVIVLLGVVIAVRVAASNAATPPPATSPPPAATTPSPGPSDPSSSVCGLPAGAPDTGTLTSPPAVTWAFEGTIPYPSSPEFGAAATAKQGYRYCFQHSQAGAVVMAANALAQGSDPELGDAWIKYALGSGRYRDQLADEIGAATGAEGSRLKVAGFRILNYTGATATVDLGVTGSSQNQNFTVSGVYELVWQAGDWKISADVQHPLDVSTVPDLAGYTPWGE